MLCLVLWQSVVLAKKNARQGFGHFGAVRDRSALEGKCMLPLASCGLLHAIKDCCDGVQRNIPQSPWPVGEFMNGREIKNPGDSGMGNWAVQSQWKGALQLQYIVVFLNLLVCWFKNGCIVNLVTSFAVATHLSRHDITPEIATWRYGILYTVWFLIAWIILHNGIIPYSVRVVSQCLRYNNLLGSHGAANYNDLYRAFCSVCTLKMLSIQKKMNQEKLVK